MSEREPDVGTDPREQGTGQGYPESNPEEATPVEGTRRGPAAGGDDAPDDAPAPDTHAGQDRDPGAATGNPDAAGG